MRSNKAILGFDDISVLSRWKVQDDSSNLVQTETLDHARNAMRTS